MKILKSYYAMHREECIAAIVLSVLACASGLLAHGLGFKDNFYYCFGIAFGVAASFGANLAVHHYRANKAQ